MKSSTLISARTLASLVVKGNIKRTKDVFNRFVLNDINPYSNAFIVY